jgi:hypothetical protein
MLSLCESALLCVVSKNYVDLKSVFFITTLRKVEQF